MKPVPRRPLPEVLARWEASGASWSVTERRSGYARIQLCACTGEPVDTLEVTDRRDLEALPGDERPAT